jgi:hypothetical protein
LCCCATYQNTRRDMITTDIAMKAFHPTTPLWRLLMVSLAQTRATRHISRCSSGTRRGRVKFTTSRGCADGKSGLRGLVSKIVHSSKMSVLGCLSNSETNTFDVTDSSLFAYSANKKLHFAA